MFYFYFFIKILDGDLYTAVFATSDADKVLQQLT